VVSPSSSDLLADGWDSLRALRWADARKSFEGALAIEESADALEGLSWAAWWLDDGETVFASRERAYHLYRADGDPASAARMATWLACDEIDFNAAISVASGWVQRAHRLLDPLESSPDHGWLYFHEGYLAQHHGDLPLAIELGARAAAIGSEFAVPDLEMLGLALRGAMLVHQTEVEEGMRCLDEAALLALQGEATNAASGTWALCFTVVSCAAARDYERAFEWCDRATRIAEEGGSRYLVGLCRADYGDVQVWRGSWPEAEAILEAAIEDLSVSRPAKSGPTMAALAELKRRQGLAAEAEELLERAGPSVREQLCRARLALSRGESALAAERCTRVLRQLPDPPSLSRVPALELLVHASIACKRLDEAAAALAELRALERVVGTAPMRACTDVAEGLLATAQGEHERARSLLEDAVDRFGECGAPYETALARLELARVLVALGRPTDAAREASAARDCLLELGAEADVRTALALLEGDNGARDPLAGVTPREREVLVLLAEGLTNRQIAERLVVSEHTVHRHVTNTLRKLDLPSRTAAAAHAVRAGLVDQPSA
jgi:LuxR family transcriptional regulator, maltose regulon positive regulatory protein